MSIGEGEHDKGEKNGASNIPERMKKKFPFIFVVLYTHYGFYGYSWLCIS
jgi:hypothetical protein